MRIGYCKLGRSWNLDPTSWSTLGGDADVWNTLDRLARRNPGDQFVLVGRNSGETPESVGLPANVVNPWTELRDACRGIAKRGTAGIIQLLDEIAVPLFYDLDAVLVWAGQHGTSNTPIPAIGKTWLPDDLTNPQDSFVLYCSYILRGISAWREVDPHRREEVWLVPDPRNYLKARDLRWPLHNSIVSQYDQGRHTKFGRYAYDEPTPEQAEWFRFRNVEAGHVWVAETWYSYDALELTALPETATYPDLDAYRFPFGLIVNENRRNVSNPRLDCLKKWVVPWAPDCEISGAWNDVSQRELGRTIEPIPHAHLEAYNRRYRSTFTMPASGSGWATAKAWESFLYGTICFFHPKYDTQGHIIPIEPNGQDADKDHLAAWLRPRTPAELQSRVQFIADNDEVYRGLADLQFRVVSQAIHEQRAITEIERRMHGLEVA